MAPATSPPTRTSAWVTRWMRAIMTGGIVWHLARLVRNIRGRFLLAETPMHRRGRGGGGGGAGAPGAFDLRVGGGPPWSPGDLVYRLTSSASRKTTTAASVSTATVLP